MRLLIFACLLLLGNCLCRAEEVLSADPLVWDSVNKTNHVKASEISSRFTFNVRNDGTQEELIDDVKTSCGCTIVRLPSKPWHLKPKETGQLEVIVDLRGKYGMVYKDVTLISTNEQRRLLLTVDIDGKAAGAPSAMDNRMWGQQLAAVDRQAIFTQKECLQCHLIPGFGKSGESLFHASCGICHESPRRATMVPDLGKLKTEIDGDYWRNWVTHGKPGTLMPGFTAREHGPLTDAQIDSLVAYLTTAFPRPLKTAANEKPPAPKI